MQTQFKRKHVGEDEPVAFNRFPQGPRSPGDATQRPPPVDRMRAGAWAIHAAWTAFVIAGISFAKFSEHFDEA
jgi:hypothetical protein